MLQRDALEQEGYPPDEPGPEFMDMAMPDSEQYAPEEDDEDQIYMQQAANDTLLALQLLRSQFPAKARVGTFHHKLPWHRFQCCRNHTCTGATLELQFLLLYGCLPQGSGAKSMINNLHATSNYCLMLIQEVIVPFMLRSQLYSLVEDRTLVDRELDELRYTLAAAMLHELHF